MERHQFFLGRGLWEGTTQKGSFAAKQENVSEGEAAPRSKSAT